jgi:hypothetical protein
MSKDRTNSQKRQDSAFAGNVTLFPSDTTCTDLAESEFGQYNPVTNPVLCLALATGFEMVAVDVSPASDSADTYTIEFYTDTGCEDLALSTSGTQRQCFTTGNTKGSFGSVYIN